MNEIAPFKPPSSN